MTETWHIKSDNKYRNSNMQYALVRVVVPDFQWFGANQRLLTLLGFGFQISSGEYGSSRRVASQHCVACSPFYSRRS